MARPTGNISPPPPDSLPPWRRLIVYATLAVIAIAVITLTIVLPAEKGVDPTGLGRVIGLTQMGEVKLILAMDAADHEAEEKYARESDSLALVAPGADTLGTGSVDDTRLEVGAGETAEIRLVMKRGARVSYAWTVEGSPVRVVAFADPVNAVPSRSRAQGTDSGTGATGEIVAGFDGWHGLRWFNPANVPVTIALRTSGRYLGGRQGIVDQRNAR
jgi:hypothetical protein